MSLKDFASAVSSRTIKRGKHSIVVRPLSLNDFVSLLATDEMVLAAFAEGDISVEDLVTKSPKLVARMIFQATHAEGDTLEDAMGLPMSLQLEIVEALWELSIPDSEFFGRFLGKIVEGVQKLLGSLESGSSKNEKKASPKR